MQRRITIALLVSLVATQRCFALSVDDLKRGVDQALVEGGPPATELATYVTGYVHGSAEYGRTLGLVCDEAGLHTTADELQAVRAYMINNPDEWSDGAQLLINRALTSPLCRH